MGIPWQAFESPPAELVRRLALRLNPRSTAIGWDRAYRRSVRASWVRSVLKLKTGEAAAVIEQAESAGWVTRHYDEDGRLERVRLEPLGVLALGMGGECSRPPLAPTLLDGLPHAEIVRGLARFAASVVLVERLASNMDTDSETLWEALEVAERDGMVGRWADHPVSPAVGLSSWTAASLGLTLSADGSTWLTPGERDLTDAPLTDLYPRFQAPDNGEDDDLLDHLADPDAGEGMDQCEAYETAEGIADALLDLRSGRDLATGGYDRLVDAADQFDRLRRRLPEVRTLLGMRITWPILIEIEGNKRRWTPEYGPCPGCGDRSMRRVEMCLVCDASGLDAVLAVIRYHDEDRAVEQARHDESIKTQARIEAERQGPKRAAIQQRQHERNRRTRKAIRDQAAKDARSRDRAKNREHQAKAIEYARTRRETLAKLKGGIG